MKAIRHSLSVRLFLWLAGGMGVVFLLYAVVNLRSFSQLWIQTAEDNATQTSELIKSSTYYGMLLNRKDDVHQTIRRIAQQRAIAGIRIYDKQGTIMFSATESEIGRRVDFNAEACLSCHDQSGPVRPDAGKDRLRIYQEAGGQRVLALINPIENEPACYNAACHAHPKSQTILGVLDVKMSLNGLDESLVTTRRQVLGATIFGLMLLAGISALFIFRLVRVPVRKLAAGAERVADGDLSTRLEVVGAGELTHLARVFNEMTDKLEKARQEITEWSQHLEQKVLDKTNELGRSQRQVLQMEKMASLGKLAASVAHELNNPLGGILTYAKLISRTLKEEQLPEKDRQDLLKFLEHIQNESSRCGEIVRNLLLFARQSNVTFASNSLGAIVERSRMVVQHHLQMANVKWEYIGLEGDDHLICDSNAIQQALVALFVNATEAMTEGGTLRVHAKRTPDGMQVDVSDTGVGISAEDLPRIFEPFFSTKESTSGVGLGLAVVYGIVERHRGTIDVSSEVGKGTTFHIVLPADGSVDRRKEG